jgi:hypothetical protein
MSIEVRKVDDSYGIWAGYTCEFINPATLLISEERIKDYVKDNPFPEDPDYSLENCIDDLTRSEGSYIIPTKKRETAEYIAELIYKLI